MEAKMKHSRFMKATLVAFFVFSQAHAEDKWLTLQLNQTTFVRIANVQCPVKELSKTYPWGAVAYNSKRREYLFGCFNKKNEDEIVIQWAGGDKSVFPANAFLMENDKN